MSWLGDFTNPDGPPNRGPIVDTNPKVDDGTGRMVSTKTANQPFLVHKQWREKEEARKKAKAARKKERAEKIARGEPVGPAEPDDEQEVGCFGLLKFLIYCALFILLASKFITGDWLWEYRGKWTNLNRYLPTDRRLFSPANLAKFDGSDPNAPIYIAINGAVYDVSANSRTYGKGGSYNHMAGVDATRAYGTGCFKDHRTHDLRGLTPGEMEGVRHWIKFFEDHKDYYKVGKVLNQPIDPTSPIPPHCNPPKQGPEMADTVEAPSPQTAVAPKVDL